MVIFSVNLLENLHTISYAILVYIYRGKKRPRLVSGHQPPRAAAGQRGSCAHYYTFILGTKEQRKEETLSSCFLCTTYNIVCAEAPVTRVAKKAISQGCHPWHFFALHICMYFQPVYS